MDKAFDRFIDFNILLIVILCGYEKELFFVLQYQLYESIAKKLAKKIIFLNEGDRLKPFRQLAEEFDTGIGTVQDALKLLESNHAIKTERFGKRGTFVTKINQPTLLSMTGYNTIIGSMPVTYSLTYKGMETGLVKAFGESNLSLIMTLVRGAKNRLHFLHTGRCDFAIISRLSWEKEKEKGNLNKIFSFGPKSNVGEHVLLLADKNTTEIKNGMKIGIDPSSHDSLQLTLEECEGKTVEFVHISYGEAYSKLISKEIDGTVWDIGTSQTLPESVNILPLSNKDRIHDTNINTEAVLVVRQDSNFLASLIKEEIDSSIIIDTQKKIVDREEKPIL